MLVTFLSAALVASSAAMAARPRIAPAAQIAPSPCTAPCTAPGSARAAVISRRSAVLLPLFLAAPASAISEEKAAAIRKVRKERELEEGRKQSEEYVSRMKAIGFGSTVYSTPGGVKPPDDIPFNPITPISGAAAARQAQMQQYNGIDPSMVPKDYDPFTP